MDSKDQQIEGWKPLVRKLTKRIDELERELAEAKQKATGKKKRKPGGQPGNQRQPLPPERVDQTIDYQMDDHPKQEWGLTLKPGLSRSRDTDSSSIKTLRAISICRMLRNSKDRSLDHGCWL